VTQDTKAASFTDKFARTLLATTCLTVAGGASASASTFLEGSVPTTHDFPSAPIGTLVPLGTDEVQGFLGTANFEGVGKDLGDWFTFQGLPGGGGFNLHAFATENGEGVGIALFDSSLHQIANGFIGHVGEAGLQYTGSVPGDGELVVDIFHGNENSATNGSYTVDLATTASPEPATLPLAGLAIGGALAWRRRRKQ